MRRKGSKAATVVTAKACKSAAKASTKKSKKAVKDDECSASSGGEGSEEQEELEEECEQAPLEDEEEEECSEDDQPLVAPKHGTNSGGGIDTPTGIAEKKTMRVAKKPSAATQASSSPATPAEKDDMFLEVPALTMTERMHMFLQNTKG
jgi:hypothetical protein